MDKKNLIFIMCDQMTGKVLDENSDYIIPALRSLENDSVNIRRAYAPNPICSPSRASLMTGTLPHTHGMVDVTHAVPSYRAEYNYNLDNFSLILKESGYSTSYYGKWHVERKHCLEKFGYDEWVTEREMSAPHYTALSKTIVSNPGTGYPDKAIGGVYEEGADASDEHFLFSKAIDFIERKKDGPFFTFISTNAPHDPYTVPKEFYDMYQDLELPESFYDPMDDKPAIYKRIRSVFSGFTPEDYKTVRRYYHAYCTLIDSEIGRLVAYLKEKGLYDDTMIVFLSDHGDLQGAHGLICKGVPAFEEGYRIPLLFKLPGNRNNGLKTDDLFSVIDIAPTVLSELGLSPLRNHIEGIDKSSSLDGDIHDYCVVAENFGQRYAYTQRIIWKDNRKYVFNGFDYDEYYDLSRDPNEMVNRIDDLECQDDVKEMCSELQRIVLETKDTTLGDAVYFMHRFLPVGPKKEAGTAEFKIYNKEF